MAQPLNYDICNILQMLYNQETKSTEKANL